MMHEWMISSYFWDDPIISSFNRETVFDSMKLFCKPFHSKLFMPSNCSGIWKQSFKTSSILKTGDENPQENYEEFDLVLHRAASMIISITERQTTKMLHIHCGDNLPKFLGKVSSETSSLLLYMRWIGSKSQLQVSQFDITGCSRDTEEVRLCKSVIITIFYSLNNVNIWLYLQTNSTIFFCWPCGHHQGIAL